MTDDGSATHSFLIGNVRLEPVFGNMKDVRADAVVQAGSAAENPDEIHTVRWVREADTDGSIRTNLRRHSPFELRQVCAIPAGTLQAKYIFHAVVVDRIQQDASQESLEEDVVRETAQKCIAIAVALGLTSIAFTPWGTRTTRTDPSRITALMIHAITQALEGSSGKLEVVYLVSNVEEHYQWFIDRSFMLAMFQGQIEQVRKTIQGLRIPTDQKQHVEQMLNTITHNIVVYNQAVQGDSIQGDKVGGDKAGGDKVGGDKVTI